MTYAQLQARVMFQTNNDADDLGDFMPHLEGYINEGYDRLLMAYAKAHVGMAEYPWLKAATEPDPEMSPILPEWIHPGIADWATWLVYRNGNPSKQQRGMQFRASAEETLARIRASGGLAGDTARASGDTTFGQIKNVPFHPYEGVPTDPIFDPYS